MKLITIIKIFDKVLSKKEIKLSKKYGELCDKNTKHRDLRTLRAILNHIDEFKYYETKEHTFRHYRYSTFELD